MSNRENTEQKSDNSASIVRQVSEEFGSDLVDRWIAQYAKGVERIHDFCITG